MFVSLARANCWSVMTHLIWAVRHGSRQATKTYLHFNNQLQFHCKVKQVLCKYQCSGFLLVKLKNKTCLWTAAGLFRCSTFRLSFPSPSMDGGQPPEGKKNTSLSGISPYHFEPWFEITWCLRGRSDNWHGGGQLTSTPFSCEQPLWKWIPVEGCILF